MSKKGTGTSLAARIEGYGRQIAEEVRQKAIAKNAEKAAKTAAAKEAAMKKKATEKQEATK